jgi:acyl-coenzyme A synthetase/AMP-(fatty) acid ligase
MTIHRHDYGIAHQVTGSHWLNLGEEDLHWNISDTGWAKAAWSSYYGPWTCGSAIFVHHNSSFNPAQTLSIIEKYPITTLCGAPTIYRMLVLEELEKYSFPSLRHCVGAGEPLNPEIIDKWQAATGLIIRDGYGQTETSILCGNFHFIEPKFGSMGKPAPGVYLSIIDDRVKKSAKISKVILRYSLNQLAHKACLKNIETMRRKRLILGKESGTSLAIAHTSTRTDTSGSFLELMM